MGTIKTTNIETITGSGTLTLGQSGETITIPSGATLTVPSGGLSGQNYPSFKATQNVSQTLSDNTVTILSLETENWDTDSAFDNTTNYRFTVPSGKAGKYVFLGTMRLSGLADQDRIQLRIYKNGSAANTGSVFYFMSVAENAVMQVNLTDDASVGDYYDLRGYHFSGESKNTGAGYSSLSGYRIGA